MPLLAAGFMACDNDDGTVPGGVGGDANIAGSAGEQPTAGNRSGGEGGGSGGVVGGNGGAIGGVGGAAGEGGDTSTSVGDYRIVETVVTNAEDLVSWPEQARVATADRVRAVVEVFQVDDDAIERTDVFEPEQLLAGANGISGLAKYGDDFVVVVSNSEQPVQQHVVKVHLGEEPETLLALPESEQVRALIADPELGIAIATRTGLKLAARDSGSWKTLVDGDRHVPLAFEDNRILVGVEELPRLGDGDGAGGVAGAGDAGGAGSGGDAGGAGGAGGLDGTAHVLWLDLDGNVVAAHPAYGDPRVAVKDDAGWLIGETNSFWGSYNAGIELLTNDGLTLLTEVPVISAGDGTDGAYDLVRDDDRLLVANCESGLLQSAFSTTELELSPLAGPWEPAWEPGWCAPTAIEAVGGTIVVGGGGKLVFMRREQ